MIKSKYPKVLLIVLVLFSGALVLLAIGAEDSQENERVISIRDYLVASFVNELPEINSKLPYKVDENTVLLSIEYINGMVISRYELLDLKATPDSSLQLISRAEPRIKRQACLDDVKKRLLDVDVEFLNKYQDSGGSEIFEVLVNRSVCSEFTPVR